MLDLLIVNGLVLTGRQSPEVVSPGYVGVSGERIESVGPMDELDAGLEAERVIDAAEGLVVPGLVNAHTHLPMSLFRGLADDLPLMAWLEENIFLAEAAFIDPETVYWGAKLAAAELLLAGVTTAVDGYFHERHVARAVTETGLRAVLGQGVIDSPAPGVPDPAANIEAAEEFILDCPPDERVQPSVFCHSPYTCSADTLVRGKELARRHRVWFQIHLAETQGEVDGIAGRHGMSPAAYLDSLGLLDDRTLLVHCVYLPEEDLDLIASRGCAVVICRESNMKLGAGLARSGAMLDRGIPVALGTDGPASNNDLSILSEMRTLALTAKVNRLDPTAMPARRVWRLGGPDGAAALGWDGRIGRIAPGQVADLVVIDRSGPNAHPMFNPYSHLVYSADGRDVKHVFVGGKPVVEDRRIITFDVPETLERCRRIARRIGDFRRANREV